MTVCASVCNLPGVVCAATVWSKIVYSDQDGHQTSGIRLLWTANMQP